MASERTEPDAGSEEETPPATDANEHDYAHTADGSLTPAEVSSPVELPEPAVGAEVDCPGGGEVDGDPPKPAARRGRRRPTRPEDRNCAGCKSEFEKQGRCFCRRAVYTFTNPETVQWVFPDSVVNDKSFLCETCAQLVRSKCKRKHTGKRYIWLKPPEVKQVSDRRQTFKPDNTLKW